ncbi:DUF2255 family protein [Allosediminivita pacifica]|uniref:DUF2255 family protein n=1 Tax=Allosediminivita pacifica TaxID=1267769 RepID=A0A2T6B7V7_9RHOB|nr:DUF2255 family protein [Allosediminivita pacifica]PTX52170.1 hypothetical protein C8N44_102219 [Allosediminivita pacifica]GGA96576.1 hypothetical protein GCM10011324_03560 [Allosediminivita pacifica]
MTWTPQQLATFAETDDFRIAPFREDGRTAGTPTFIWSVVSDGALYVRAYSGQNSSWYRAALAQGAGQIQADGETHDVHFNKADGDSLDGIDAAYREKYGDSQYLAPMISQRCRAATVEVLPRGES